MRTGYGWLIALLFPAPALAIAGAPALFYVGAGMNYWLKKNFGLRAEIREHVGNDNGTALHYFATRFGIAFRW